MKGNISENMDDKCLKLTNILKTKTMDNKKLNEENRALKNTAKELQCNLNEANNKAVQFESKVKTLENQVTNLLEACEDSNEKRKERL